MKRVSHYIAFLAAALALSSCVIENGPELSSDDVSVSLILKLPHTTRAISPEPGDESEISTVDVLAFTQVNGEWVYDYKLANITKEVNGNDMTITGTARSKKSAQVFVIVVNASAQLSNANPIKGEKMSVIENRIVASASGAGEWPARINGTGTFTPFPMYGRTGASVVNADANTIGDPTPYPIIRMVARIDVTLKSTVNNFKLEEACLFNYRTAGYVSYANSNFSGTAVSQAAVPADGDHTGDPVKRPTVHYLSDKSSDTRGEIKHSIYTFESQKITSQAGKTKGLALVIGGYYSPDGGTTWDDDLSYYRIDLKTTDDTSSNISSDVLRNHSYAVEVQSVGGPGADKDIDAYMGESLITAEIVPWDDAVQRVIGDKPYSLTVSEDDILFTRQGGTAVVAVETDYDITYQGLPAGLYISVEYSSADNNGWVTVGGNDGDLRRDITINVPDIPKTTPNIPYGIDYATVTVTAGNFRKAVKVTHNYTLGLEFAFSNVVWDNAGGKLTFATTAEETAVMPSNLAGVYFKWGSLVALSPVSNNNNKFVAGHVDSGGSIIYDPTGNYGGWGNFNGIPVIPADYGAPFNNSSGWVELSTDDFAGWGDGGLGYIANEGLGDICRYISTRGWVEDSWRLPTAAEWGPLLSSGTKVRNGSDWTDVTVANSGDNKYGWYQANNGFWIGNTQGGTGTATTPNKGVVFIPAAGMNYSEGTINVERRGYFQTGSSYQNGAWHLKFEESSSPYMIGTSGGRSTDAKSVRCIRE